MPLKPDDVNHGLSDDTFHPGADCCHSGTLLDTTLVQMERGNASRAYGYTRESIGRAAEVGCHCLDLGMQRRCSTASVQL